MEFVIAPAVVADAGEVLTVQRAAFLSEGALNNSFTLPPLTETLDEVRAVLADPDTIVLVARLGHRLAGSVRARVAGRTGHIGRLAVAPDLQGHGLGRSLTTAVEQALAGRVDRFELFTGATSEHNLRLYRRLGYVDLGRGPAAAAAGLTYLEKRV
jgi:ribosomal protein S18 acetylase RimI-like enzyme